MGKGFLIAAVLVPALVIMAIPSFPASSLPVAVIIAVGLSGGLVLAGIKDQSPSPKAIEFVSDEWFDGE